MPIWADVLLALVLAVVFAIYVAIILERVKSRAAAEAVRPHLERAEQARAAIPKILAPPIEYTTKLLDVDGNQVGYLRGMTIGYELGEIVTYATRRYEVLEVRRETEGVSNGVLVVKPL